MAAGIPLRGDLGARASLESRIAIDCKGESAQDVDYTCRFLRRCLTVDPAARATVPELLVDVWLTS